MRILPSALIPIEQAIIVFHGSEVVAVHLPDDCLAPTVHSLCAMFEIRPEGQVRRIRRDKGLAKHLLRALVETSGGLQVMDVLIAKHVSDWVMGLQLKRIAPEKRQLILAVKAEVVDALHRYFFGGQMAQPTPEPEAETASQAGPAGGGSGAAAGSPKERLFAVLGAAQDALRDLWEKEQAKDEQLARSQRALAGRVEVVEEWVRFAGWAGGRHGAGRRC